MNKLIITLSAAFALSLTVGCGDIETKNEFAAKTCCDTGTRDISYFELPGHRAEGSDEDFDKTAFDLESASAGVDIRAAGLERSTASLAQDLETSRATQAEDISEGVIYGQARRTLNEDAFGASHKADGLAETDAVAVRIYAAVTPDDVEPMDADSEGVYAHVDGELMAEVKADEEGAFGVALPEGKYSVFAVINIEDDEGNTVQVGVCNVLSKDDALCEVEVSHGASVRYDLHIDHEGND